MQPYVLWDRSCCKEKPACMGIYIIPVAAKFKNAARILREVDAVHIII